MSDQILVLSLFIHLIATTIWLGGLFITLILVYPAINRALRDAPQLYSLLSNLRRRFYPISNLCLVALIATGLFQMTADPYYDGFLTFDNTWSRVMLAKHIAIVGMALAGLILQHGVAPALERQTLLLQHTPDTETTTYNQLRQREQYLTILLSIAGLAILAFSAWATAL